MVRAARKSNNGKRSIRTSNRYVHTKSSRIHAKGLFARRDIPKGVEFVEYTGPKLTKREGNRQTDDGNVYVFSLDRKWDVDGSVLWNLARYANHSCHPNAESVKGNGKIWLKALRDIPKGEEISYNYGYSSKDYEDEPCRCGHKECVGYIVQESEWDRIRRKKRKR